MAEGFSERYVERSRRNLPLPLRLRIRFAPWIKRARMLTLWLGSKQPHESAAQPQVTSRLDAAALHFQKNKWAFVEEVFSPEFHRELIAHWPRKRYFEPPREVIKSYNTGFRWVYGDQPGFSYSDPYGQYPLFLNLLNYFRSDEMARRMTAFAGRGNELVCYSVILTETYPGSEVIPHKDSIATDAHAVNFLNMVFFINGTGGKNSGGLTLSRDNDMRHIIFEPLNLKNSVLIYDSLTDFYHGFGPIERGKFRWSIGIQFCDKRYIPKGKK